MHVSLIQALFLTLFYSIPSTWAQFPPSSLPEVSSTGSMTSSSGVSVTMTSSASGSSVSASTSGSGSGSMSMSPTKTSSAQFPSLSGVSDCVNNCLATSVAAANCDDLVGVDCWCPNDRFPLTYFNCVANGCSSDLAAAENLVEQFCKQSNATLSATSISFPSFTMTSSQSVPSMTTTSSSGTSSSGGPPAATSTNAAFSTRLNVEGYTGIQLFFVLVMTAVVFGFVQR